MTLEQMKRMKRELGFSNREISERSGVPLGTVQKIFGGKTKAPRHETIAAIEKILKSEIKDHTEYGYYFEHSPKPVREEHGVAEEAVVYDAGAGTGKVLRHQGPYTIKDWEDLPDDVHAELINGYLYYMAAPLTVHQELVTDLTVDFKNFVRENHGNCHVFPAPYGIRLFLDDKTMVEPDISIICNRDQITRKWTDGAPDLAVEVLSPSNKKHDLVEKLKLYEDAGVKEYWIVDPKKKRVMVYLFNDADVVHIYTFQDKVPVGIWDGKCVVDFAEIMDEISYLYDEKGNLK